MWVLEVSGVICVWVMKWGFGFGIVVVCFVCDNDVLFIFDVGEIFDV